MPDLIQAIEAFLAAWNRAPKVFVWTAKAEDIIAKTERARAVSGVDCVAQISNLKEVRDSSRRLLRY